MTREEAIKILSKETSMEKVNELKYYAGFSQTKVVEMIQEAMEMGAKALEKQIPKEVINKDDFYDYAECPSCKSVATDFLGCMYGYCRKCGQRLKWSEEND